MNTRLRCTLCHSPFDGPENHFVCPHCGGSIAAAVKLNRAGIIGPQDKVVCVLTGSGLRDLKLFAREEAVIPEVLPGDMDGLHKAVTAYQK
ncbi:MAG: hypothetical protein J6E42_09060 [Firmicutes bacterium]|nr:hypothetical protein [Bacillota bacterium]